MACTLTKIPSPCITIYPIKTQCFTATMKGCPLVTAEGTFKTRQWIDTDGDTAATGLNDLDNRVG